MVLLRLRSLSRERKFRNTGPVENQKISPRARTKSGQQFSDHLINQSVLAISSALSQRGFMRNPSIILLIVVCSLIAAQAQSSAPPAAQKAMNAIDPEKIRAT